ncbi:MAG: proteasome accessory factor PafA2 [Candidatus Nanopelagicales bacterium]|jgi:proteasome accessory factor A|nr:proteasome accessory factor PafA2 [Candidatus Nanopelagicales bacterium]
MSVRRVMGIETEYGISHPGHPNANPIRMSGLVVNAHALAAERAGALARRWDYDEESPLRDARGFDMSRADADVSQLTDDTTTANVVLTNGARLYVDHAHPEYSSPEVTNPWDAVLWDRAGMAIAAGAAQRAADLPGGHEVVLYKNNTDGKGASYGTHENYLMDRRVPFTAIVAALTPFLVTRQVFTGAGRVGLGQDGRGSGFQLSSRADFFEVEVGLETTLKRPIINTRDEPHADPATWRRLHVIVGDANLSETATLLKLGTTAVVLAMIEAGGPELGITLANPVQAMHRVSHDVAMTAQYECLGRAPMTALQIQRAYLEAAQAHVAARPDPDPQTKELLELWAEVLDLLGEQPRALADRLDWVAKLVLLEGYRRRDGLDWSAHRLAAVDLQYADTRPDRGLALRLEQRGSLRRITTDADVARAIDQAPADTRAWFRGECVRRFGGQVAAASWDSVIFDVPGRNALVRVPTSDPLRGTREHVAALLDSVGSVGELVAALGGGTGPGR